MLVLTCGFGLVGNDAAHKVRRCHVQVVHQSVQRFLPMQNIANLVFANGTGVFT